jgi:N-acetylglucosamine-6-sulfatase
MAGRTLLTLAAGVLLAGLGTVGNAPTPVAATAPPARPNIVMFYIDDAAPHDGRLWNDPGRTPNIYNQFIAHGIHLDQAIGETPLCCPSRANVLTGQHTHNTRVVSNDARLFDPAEHIGKALLDADYASMFIGKYLNRDSLLTPEQWAEHDAGWTVLDAINGINGAFYNFALHTKTGDIQVTGLHSTQMVADRAVMHFKETPAETPIFALLSIYNVHAPNVPEPGDKGDPRCANMPPWNPPNYNEADVSDKPQGIRALPLQPYADGWPMVGYCEEMLGVDRAVGQVVAELAAENRLDNTLLMFAADNGMTWGAHRLGQQKVWPYATPLPLYLRWPAAHWGDTAQTISEVVSDIDYAPTWCALAGPSCVLGPFNRGSTGPDGVNLAPLLNGDAANAGRDAVLEESYAGSINSWSGLRTTAVFDPDHRWHYAEYTNGERELYDSINDPWELTNIVGQSSKASLVATLHARLAQLRVHGIGPGTGTIVMREDAFPDYGFDYQFHGDLGNFVLDDDGGADATRSNEATFTNVPAGEYTITRAANLPWAFSGTFCDGVGVSSTAAGKLVVYLHPGETVTCTWVDAQRRPDASVALSKTGVFKLDNFYSSTAVKKQTVRRNGVVVGHVYDYYVHLQNDSGAPDTLTMKAVASGPKTVTTRFIQAGFDVTADVVTDEYDIALNPGTSTTVRVRVKIGVGTPIGSVYRLVLTAASTYDPTRVDVVRLVAAR